MKIYIKQIIFVLLTISGLIIKSVPSTLPGFYENDLASFEGKRVKIKGFYIKDSVSTLKILNYDAHNSRNIVRMKYGKSIIDTINKDKICYGDKVIVIGIVKVKDLKIPEIVVEDIKGMYKRDFLKKEVLKASQIGMESVYNEIIKIQDKYFALKGFKENVVISNQKQEYDYCRLEFIKNVAPAKKEYPLGILINSESCLIRIIVQDSEGPFVTGKPFVLDFGLRNINVSVRIDINVTSNELKTEFSRIIGASFKQLEELDRKY